MCLRIPVCLLWGQQRGEDPLNGVNSDLALLQTLSTLGQFQCLAQGSPDVLENQAAVLESELLDQLGLCCGKVRDIQVTGPEKSSLFIGASGDVNYKFGSSHKVKRGKGTSACGTDSRRDMSTISAQVFS